jgi:outer membrane lipoprotein-sorting protein
MTARAVIAFALLLCVGSACAATADELISKNIVARGGADKLAAIKTLKMQGQVIAGGGFKLSYAEYLKRPDKLRQEASVQGLTQVQAWDGQRGWSIQPFGGRKDPIPMSADDARELAEGADIDGAWVDAAAKGNTVTYLGTEDVDGTSAHKLQVQLKDGNTLVVYLDPDAYLPIREIARRTVRGTQQVTQTDYGDYEKVDGVYFPFAITTGPKGGTSDQMMQITIDKAQANVPVEDSVFAFPEKNVASAAAQGSK